MLKWLRKYNTYILVVGGCLLMVAFLLQGTLQDLSRRGIIGGKVMRVSGSKVTQEQYQQLGFEYHALTALLGDPRVVQLAGGGDNLDHWILLCKEAEAGGFIGGQKNGADFITPISRFVMGQVYANNPFISQEQLDKAASNFAADVTARVPRVASESRITEQAVFETLAKLNGIMRMRSQYYSALRYSDRRLIAGVKDISDSADLEFVLVPPARAMDGIPEPDAAAIQASFDRFKDTPQGGGDFGIGYKLPARVKITWIEIDKKAISDAVTPDPVEVQKAFLRKYPTGKPPEGKSLDDARKEIETDVRNQLVDKIMRTAEEVIRAEIGRSVSKLDSDGDYRKLPADWAAHRPDYVRIAADIIARVTEVTGTRIIEPKVGIRDTAWQTEADLRNLDGVGRAFLRRGSSTESFPQLVFKARELDKPNDTGLQVGVPYTDALTDGSGNRYYFTILDARRESAPDSIDEVRADVIKNIKRLAAFDKLKAEAPAYRQRSIADGLDAIAKAPAGATGEAATALTVRSVAIEKTRTIPQAPDLDSEAFRKTVREVAASLDPLSDLKTVDVAARTIVTPIDKSLSLFVGRVKGLTPMTYDRYRTLQPGMVRQLSNAEMPREEKSDPFTLANMEKRFNVEYLDGRKNAADKAKDEPKSATAE